ncbi:MAG: glutamate-5-semialdehyde dehydrogenase [SAR202 cluster bacterium]|nr:glutamate-5-semialdehyde dehydrogenase [SAR202 cluster bacterium]|tara:strand:+ start:5501 stop:6775 length:1275 start_codon:yes stop_codon:yes gene_type:complete
MTNIDDELMVKGSNARLASKELAKLSSDIKNEALLKIANNLESNCEDIIQVNAKDIDAGKEKGLTEALLDRLLLNQDRVIGMANDLRNIVNIPDPVGVIIDQKVLPNGLNVSRRRVPLGVIGAIYESRPNVTIDISALCLKSGNAVILRGGSEAINSNRILSDIVRQSIADVGLPIDSVCFVDSPDRSIVDQMLTMKNEIDLLIPRGGADFIRYVGNNATMPVITGGIGVCHTYVDQFADLEKSVAISYNAKVQRPTVCNAMDTLIIHSAVASSYLTEIAKKWSDADVEIHCDEKSMSILDSIQGLKLKQANDGDWGTEFLSLTVSVAVVNSLEEALDHIDRYGSGHSEAIITEDQSNAMKFLDDVDAAAVFVNASTRFTDGSALGLGAEVAISTNKMHARGPMGLNELTSYKWTIIGDGQVRE